MNTTVLTTLLLLGSWCFPLEASRIVVPTDSELDFETPVLTNGIYGGPPTDFNVTANISIPSKPCSDYEAVGKIVLLAYTTCNIATQIDKAIKAGAVAILIDMMEPNIIGRFSNMALATHPINFPLFMCGSATSGDIKDIFSPSSNSNNAPAVAPPLRSFESGNTTVTVELYPGRNQWHEEVIDTPWFMFLQIFFCAAYAGLLTLVIVKFIKKYQHSGFMWNISFAYLLIQACFCILVIIRWFDPLLTRGLYLMVSEPFWDTMPTSWAFIALSLMAFFWFETLNQFANTKVSPFLSKKLQIPFYIFAAFIVLIPVIGTLIDAFVGRSLTSLAFILIHLSAMFVVAAFYTVVAVKSISIIERSKQLNVTNKKRVHNLMKSHVSIVLSCVIACMRPLLSFFLHFFSLQYMYLLVVAIVEESFFFGVLLCVQVVFMPNKPPSSSATSGSANKSTNGGDANKPTAGSSIHSHSAASQDQITDLQAHVNSSV